MPRKKHVERVDMESLPSPVDSALSMVSFGPPIDPIITINDLMKSAETLKTIAESATVGASITTIEMQLGLPEDMLKNWLRIGKDEPSGPFFLFYAFFTRAQANARIAAEARVLTTNPLKWLEMNNLKTQLKTDNEQQHGVVPGIVSKAIPQSTTSQDNITGQIFLEVDTDELKEETEDSPNHIGPSE